MKKLIIAGLTLFTLAACSVSRATPAPVVNATSPNSTTSSNTSSTTNSPPTSTASATNSPTGTTINKVDSDEDGPVVNTTPAQTTTKAPVTKKKSSSATTSATPTPAVATTATTASLGSIQWLTPTQGKIVSPYSTATKGVDIEGREGQAIVAAAAGKVAYSGSGLKGYGNLIIIKHADNYLTAYSHNKINLVKEGDIIKRGQKIAELGKTDSDRPILHFEIRKNGKPINPSSIFTKASE